MRLRFRDLKAAGVVNNRVTLGNWIRKLGFPPGQLTGPNSRTWSEAEVQAWLAGRPTAMKPVPKSPGRPRKAITMTVEA
jgi:hypothetical protein